MCLKLLVSVGVMNVFLLRLSCKILTATFCFSDDLLRKVTAINDEFDAQVNSLKSTITDAESATNSDKAEMQAQIVHLMIQCSDAKKAAEAAAEKRQFDRENMLIEAADQEKKLLREETVKVEILARQCYELHYCMR